MLVQLIIIITCIIIFKLVIIFILAFVKQRVKSGLQNCIAFPGLLMWEQNWLIEQKDQGLYWRSATCSLIIVYFWVIVLSLSDTQLHVLFFKKVVTCNKGKGMCCWFGWHFHDSLSYNGVTFSIELLEWGHTFSGFGKFSYIKVRIYKQEGSN